MKQIEAVQLRLTLIHQHQPIRPPLTRANRATDPAPRQNSEWMKPKIPNCGVSLLTAITATYFVTASAHAADQKPNILYIVSDDQGWKDVG